MEEKNLINIINQIAEIERKSNKDELHQIIRHIDRIKNDLFELGFSYRFPLGEKYDETRTDCEASIVGDSTNNLVITKVIKPLIIQEDQGYQIILQRANVIVESV
jgi:hypothetical protein